MQTTLRIDDDIYREAKAEAAREGVTLTHFLQEALMLRLQKGKAARAKAPIRFRTYRGGTDLPFDDRLLKEISNREQEISDLEKLKKAGF